jgi:hypothetical protein
MSVLFFFGGFFMQLGTITALAVDNETLAIIAGVGVGVMIMVFFGLRFWLVSTRPAAIQDVATPQLDQLNRKALEHMAGETLEEDEAETNALANEEAPQDLKAVLPPELSTSRPAGSGEQRTG